MSADEVAAAFVEHYYTTIDTDPTQLQGLYTADSVLTFEGTRLEGPQAIIEKLA
ncbi:NTF2B, partial [Symbiodinium microadriaticum]